MCIKASSERIEERDLQLIGLLAERKIPTVVVFTRSIGDTEKKFVEEAQLIIDEKYRDFLKGGYVSVNSEKYVINEDIVIEVKGCVFRFVRPPVPVSSGQAFRCDPASMI